MALFKKNSKVEISETPKQETKKWDPKEGELIVDVYETEKELVVQAAIAGIDNDQIDISLEGDILIIKGQRENPTKDKERLYFTKECYWGSFTKEIILPRTIDASKIDARIKDGILMVRMPKAEKAKRKKISIEE
jgi:HSP20 family protein